MSQEHTEGQSAPHSPHSSHHSLQDFPPLPTRPTPPASTRSKRSWISGKKGEGSSTLTTRASRSLRDLLQGSKKAQEKQPDPSSRLNPVPSSPPAIPPLNLSSSLQTVRQLANTFPSHPPPPSIPSGSRPTTSPPIPQIDSHAPPRAHHGSQTDPSHHRPLSPYAWIRKPSPSSPPTYEELQQQLKILLSEKAQPMLNIEESLPVTKSSPPTITVQIAQEWQMKHPPNTGGDNEPPAPKPTPSTKSSMRSSMPSLYTSS
ncbi:uncharacterized protein ARMOST_08232 [Armillaria ostoyae]|uniref:Uncharacterized protein n=1 Tax=Armillaria ostoyae TaxID=47428 RepID=A0A284R807_ARMOS|nr:uncharacterized protein ARMOST_08232 [Armillaria ostoyae]